MAGSAISASNQCRKPRVADAHGVEMAGPYGDGQQHDVAGREAGDGHAAQQLALGTLVQRLEPVGIERHDAVAEIGHRPGEAIAATRVPVPAERQPPCGEIDPRRLQPAFTLEPALDLAHAGAAMHALDHQVQHVGAAACLPAYERRHIQCRRRRILRVGAADRVWQTRGGHAQRSISRCSCTYRSSPRRIVTWAFQAPIIGSSNAAR